MVLVSLGLPLFSGTEHGERGGDPNSHPISHLDGEFSVRRRGRRRRRRAKRCVPCGAAPCATREISSYRAKRDEPGASTRTRRNPRRIIQARLPIFQGETLPHPRTRRAERRNIGNINKNKNKKETILYRNPGLAGWPSGYERRLNFEVREKTWLWFSRDAERCGSSLSRCRHDCVEVPALVLVYVHFLYIFFYTPLSSSLHSRSSMPDRSGNGATFAPEELKRSGRF